jgi:predicted transposase YbfD/YdcC
MPAAPSSLTDPAIGQLLTAAQALSSERGRLLAVLAAVPDPRARRGVRHRLAVILSLALCAVLAGARSFTAIAEWAADADQATLDALGVTGVVPCESTFRRTLQNLDADALDDAAGAWAQQRTVPAPGVRRMVAVDGKTLRGSGLAGGPGRHLLAALDHAHGVALGQVDVEAKTNEIPMFATLLDHVGLTGAVVTADAMHAQRGHAKYLVNQRGAHYLLTVKGNQPGLHAQLAALPWRQVPVAHDARERGHGRGAAHREGHRRGRRAGLPARRPGHPDRSPPAAADQQEVVCRDRLCDHLADGHPGTARRARRHHPRPLVNRGPAALGPFSRGPQHVA